MSEHLVTNANDVELIIKSDDTTLKSAKIVVDEFTITREESADHVSGVGKQNPHGLTNGDITHSFSFTMMGENVDLFEMVATSGGKSKTFSFTAQKLTDGGSIKWSYSLDTCKATTEELSGTSGDPIEYAVDGNATSVSKSGTSMYTDE